MVTVVATQGNDRQTKRTEWKGKESDEMTSNAVINMGEERRAMKTKSDELPVILFRVES